MNVGCEGTKGILLAFRTPSPVPPGSSRPDAKSTPMLINMCRRIFVFILLIFFSQRYCRKFGTRLRGKWLRHVESLPPSSRSRGTTACQGSVKSLNRETTNYADTTDRGNG